MGRRQAKLRISGVDSLGKEPYNALLAERYLRERTLILHVETPLSSTLPSGVEFTSNGTSEILSLKTVDSRRSMVASGKKGDWY